MNLKTLYTTLIITGSPLLISSATGEETDTPASVDAALKDQDQFAALMTEYKTEYKRIRLIILPEKDLKKRMARFRSELPKKTGYIERALTLAKENPEAKGIQQGLLWSLTGASPKQYQEINELFLTHHKDSELMPDFLRHYTHPLPGGEIALDAFRQIIEKAADQKIRLQATYYLANLLMQDEATRKEGLAEMKKLVTSPDLEKMAPEFLAHAKGEILAAEKLSIGSTAPDIVGTDHDGKEFKLSDYRGQVVLVHFWGIW